jgi:hypothetical protein
MFALEIARQADAVKREALIQQRGYQNRVEIQEYLRSQANVTDNQFEATMAIYDAEADQWARNRGLDPTEATRDAYYATVFADNSEQGSGKLYQMDEFNSFY